MINKILRKLLWYFSVPREFRYLRRLPRYQVAAPRLLSKEIRIADQASFLFIYDEIFLKEIYKFNTDKAAPYIIDCGANIGLSIIYFKQLYPQAEILGFEPDPGIFNMLEYNIRVFSFDNVTVLRRGVWAYETVLKFFSEGADGGRAAMPGDSGNIISIETVRLRDHLVRDIDLLKIDIEGAEAMVLEDCRDRLGCVKNIFVEYHSFSGQDQTLHHILTILHEAGFKYCIHHVGVFSPHPFYKIHHASGMDLQLNIYGYRKQTATA